MIDWNKLKETNSLEDFYNILCRNKPHHKNKLYNEWNYLESIAYEELLIEDERPNKCENIIDQIIEYLKKQKTEVLERNEQRI